MLCTHAPALQPFDRFRITQHIVTLGYQSVVSRLVRPLGKALSRDQAWYGASAFRPPFSCCRPALARSRSKSWPAAISLSASSTLTRAASSAMRRFLSLLPSSDARSGWCRHGRPAIASGSTSRVFSVTLLVTDGSGSDSGSSVMGNLRAGSEGDTLKAGSLMRQPRRPTFRDRSVTRLRQCPDQGPPGPNAFGGCRRVSADCRCLLWCRSGQASSRQAKCTEPAGEAGLPYGATCFFGSPAPVRARSPQKCVCARPALRRAAGTGWQGASPTTKETSP